MTEPVSELRLSLTVQDFERLRTFYREAVGLEEVASWEDSGHGVVFAAGRATLELLDAEHAAHVDRIEVGTPTGASVRIALEVADASAAATRASDGGAVATTGPVTTPWGDTNARVRPPEGPAVTFFSSPTQPGSSTAETAAPPDSP
jgi:catechol 2,3-dioxygenase-like lactoylglutathione lyase family enzyme